MKYGIKHTAGAIEAISKFPTDVVAAGFTEITEAKYNEFIADFNSNPFCTYNDSINKIEKDAVTLSSEEALLTAKEMRLELLKMSNELDLKVRLGESTTTLQAEFDTLKTTYQSL